MLKKQGLGTVSTSNRKGMSEYQARNEWSCTTKSIVISDIAEL